MKWPFLRFPLGGQKLTWCYVYLLRCLEDPLNNWWLHCRALGMSLPGELCWEGKTLSMVGWLSQRPEGAWASLCFLVAVWGCLEDTLGEGSANLLMGKGRLTRPPGRAYCKQFEEALYCSLWCLLQVLQKLEGFFLGKARKREGGVDEWTAIAYWAAVKEGGGGKLGLYLL